MFKGFDSEYFNGGFTELKMITKDNHRSKKIGLFFRAYII